MSSLLVLFSLLSACGETATQDSGPTADVRYEEGSLSNSGYACIEPSQEQADAAEITVTLSDCLPACAEPGEASCEAVLEGETLEVTAEGSYTVTHHPEQDCAAICLELTAQCAVGALPEGALVFQYGGEDLSLEAPLSSEHCTGP